ncbi:hypothetical protein BCIN_09g06040 [Botrytis cinerea B05.10]|uniref:Uncharacterized protein n=1 Tax=Botryotinia fuckeliana (strain B05.10) TaxID=332648 RepID=A0A384JTF9_BOTFB|nr:hypothetical protein BCIN_09g06040 [Botrytis cinerea B05.10]ATZ53833.1 hypothetical protein BCIN_09g06040 [Botrytis cinerea B05.10]
MSFFVLLTSILILLLSIPLFYRTKWWRDGLEQVCFRRIPINALSISSLPSNFSMLLTPVLRISLSRPISTMSFFLNHLKSHTLVTLPIPEKKFTGKTIIVTGSNSGLGLEAARWFVRLDAQKVILAVRSLSKGEAARQSIISSTSCSPDTLEVWNLDLCSQSSVREFAHRANALPRLDVLVSNAGIYVFDFEVAEENEETICVNVINTFLLALLLLPKLRETSIEYDTRGVMTFTGSFVHHLTTFPERRAGNVFEELRVEERADMKDRYNVSKLISLLFSRELAFALRESERRGREGHVVANIVNPGLVDTEIMRHATGATKHLVRGAMKLMARSVEEGSRTLVHAAGGEEETNGMYLDDCKIGKVSPWTTSLDGIATQKDIWMELSQELEKVEPGIMGNV